MIDENNKIFMISLGCAKNLVDAEVMLGKLKNAESEIVTTPEQANIIIVNTCSFIRDAKMESIETILEMADHKTQNGGRCEKLIVTGCLSQRYIQELMVEMPEVDAFVGTGEYHRIVEIIQSHDKMTRNYVAVPEYLHHEKDKRILATPHYTAWLKIAEGCDRYCSFCIIPQIRGRVRSRTIDSLVIEARSLVQNGVRELNLIAQDLSQYGKDLRGATLPSLLDQLEDIEGLDWIRLLYHYPDRLSEELAQKINSSRKICSYLDVPIQHFSNSMLKAMNRKITGEKILEKIEMLRDVVPGISLRTSLIVGFPGETDRDFECLLAGLEKAQFNHVGFFGYSDEEGTKASFMSEKIDSDVIAERLQEAHEIQREISDSLNARLKGMEMDVLIEGLHSETDLLVQGRHQGQAPEVDGKILVNDDSGVDLHEGDLVRVQISDSHEYDLVGKIIPKD